MISGTINAQAIKRVAKKDKNDSSKAESVVRKQKDNRSQPKDEFIDKDGDGINDQVAKQKPPLIKRQEPQKTQPPETDKPSQPVLQPPSKPKVTESQPPRIKAPEKQKQKPKEPERKESNSAHKKSKR
jgi:hypothetical protein